MPNPIVNRRVVLAGDFSPRSISGLQAWYDASQVAGLSDGAAVTTLPDLSGRANDATQGTAANRALYKTAIQNGKPALLYDHTNDTYATGTISHNIGTGGFWMGAIVKCSNTNQSALCIMSNGSFAPALYFHLGKIFSFWTTNKFFATSVSNNTVYYVELVRVGATLSAYVNGVQDANTFTVATSMANAVLNLGSSGGSEFWQDYIFEQFFYNVSPTSANRASMSAYVAAKYGILVS